MKTHNRLLDYKIVNMFGVQVADMSCAFKYKGFEVSMSTVGYSDGGCLHEIAVYDKDNKLVNQLFSVEDAIKFIDTQTA